MLRRVAGRVRPQPSPVGPVVPASLRLGGEQAMSGAAAMIAAQPEVHPFLEDGTLTIGRHAYCAPQIRKLQGETNKVILEDFAGCSPDVTVYVGGNHNMEWVSVYGFREMFGLPGAFESGGQVSHGDVRICSDAIVHEHATVMSGVTVHKGAIVGTRSVVTKDVPPYTIVAGNPARFIRKRFEDHQIEALLRIAWWEWPIEKILEEVPYLNGAPVDEFIARHDPGP